MLADGSESHGGVLLFLQVLSLEIIQNKVPSSPQKSLFFNDNGIIGPRQWPLRNVKSATWMVNRMVIMGESKWDSRTIPPADTPEGYNRMHTMPAVQYSRRARENPNAVKPLDLTPHLQKMWERWTNWHCRDAPCWIQQTGCSMDKLSSFFNFVFEEELDCTKCNSWVHFDFDSNFCKKTPFRQSEKITRTGFRY